MLVDEAGPDPKRRSAFMQSAKYKLARENEKNVKACCANPSCLKPWFESQEKSPFQVCSKCKFTYYCSVCRRLNISFDKQLMLSTSLGPMSGIIDTIMAVLVGKLMIISIDG
jgi:hypothetical protein